MGGGEATARLCHEVFKWGSNGPVKDMSVKSQNKYKWVIMI